MPEVSSILSGSGERQALRGGGEAGTKLALAYGCCAKSLLVSISEMQQIRYTEPFGTSLGNERGTWNLLARPVIILSVTKPSG